MTRSVIAKRLSRRRRYVKGNGQRPTGGRRPPLARALAQLRRIKQRFARYIGKTYGHLAADCATCPTPCCADAQFVNVHIVRLEAKAMLATLQHSPKYGPAKVREVLARAADAIARYGLTETGDTFGQTYACPLFEPGVGCLVHWKAKPAACIQHGCYERWEDLPETGTQRRVERQVAALDAAVHGAPSTWLPIPLWLLRAADEADESLDFRDEAEPPPRVQTAREGFASLD
ncbi:hypothetical protein [Chloracidobacterium aggregatum]|uniref:YkgJ family cysteine cluster protein n=1 Tax=Chloracidobacterium sp. N TaxID=2821540 RepID=A0ABX8AY66_9BACT|nr:hypothetical protein [Chloracidobacterium aggregatum]QUV83985.1 hypothetical protein J8C03_07460 [Chloracidobacterium sp. 2]QUV87531.1 hypothetical protein J8C07_10185 [Chloracidobacterium sp. S]QUV90430.1 hypothetical protein J8C04_09180 [Chloracidobacterium sp. A]QUV93643.1 hypothetical protein J8C05_09750 [Chloracidobacterium sp. N]QUV96797.1 hypothetical protein J8C00_10895 [Chloracidobacterium sp. E]